MPAQLPPCCRLPGASTGDPGEKKKIEQRENNPGRFWLSTPGVLRLLVPSCLSASMYFSEAQELLPVLFTGCSCV